MLCCNCRYGWLQGEIDAVLSAIRIRPIVEVSPRALSSHIVRRQLP